jgi:hypothetical protein
MLAMSKKLLRDGDTGPILHDRVEAGIPTRTVFNGPGGRCNSVADECSEVRRLGQDP